MILSPSTLVESLFPKHDPSQLDNPSTFPVPFSEELLDLSRALQMVAGQSPSALGWQLELHRKRMADDPGVESLDSFPRASELLGILQAAQDFTDDGVYLSSVIWSLARGLPEATVHLEGFERIPLRYPDQAEAMLHCAREGLRSAASFKADEVWLRLRRCGDQITLEVEDNGSSAEDRPAHDLIGLATRITTLKGELTVENRQRQGWKMFASLPDSPLSD